VLKHSRIVVPLAPAHGRKRTSQRELDTSENNRRAKCYAIIAAGRKQLTREAQYWNAITMALTKVLQGA